MKPQIQAFDAQELWRGAWHLDRASVSSSCKNMTTKLWPFALD